MIPNFALSLSPDGIRLVHRTENGWEQVGQTAFDAPDLDAQMSRLRARAGELEPAPLRTKLLISNEKITYLALDTTQADEDEVRAALEGVTPHPVDELVYDFVRGYGRTYIAAVARDTLAEAESFASKHEMGPVCFAAQAEPFTFVGEVFFGPTRAAETLLPQGEMPEREPAPVDLPGAILTARPMAQAEAQILQTVRADATEAKAPGAAKAEPTLVPAARHREQTAEAGAAALVADRRPAAGRGTSEDAEAVDRLRRDAEASLRHDRGALAPEPMPRRRNSQFSIPGSWDTAPKLGGADRKAEGTIEPPHPAVALRARVAAARETAPAPSLASRAPSEKPAPISPAQSERPVSALSAASEATIPPAVAAQLAARPHPSPKAETKRGSPDLRSSRRGLSRAEKTTAARATEEERNRMTIFGAREPASHFAVSGKPRFLGVTLTALLLVFLVAVAAMAAMREDGLIALFTPDASLNPEITAATPSVQIAAADAPPLSAPAPKADEESDAITPALTVPDPLTAEGEVEVALNRQGPSAERPEPASGRQAPLSDRAPLGQVLSPAEAQRIYAATGVWQRAPRLPLTPRGETLEGVSIAAIHPVAATRAGVLPDPGAALTDARMPIPADPPPPGSDFELDARGFIAATAEGTVLPDGTLVRAGQPARMPLPRPASVNAERAAAAIPTLEEKLRDVNLHLPVLRPEGLVAPETEAPETEAPETEASAAEVSEAPETEVAEAEIAEPASPALPEFAGLWPPTRPENLAPLTAPQTNQPATTTLAAVSFDGLRPPLRPEGLAPQAAPGATPTDANGAPSAAVDMALAEALTEDPFEGASEQAVIASPRPDPRPRDIGRIVEQAERAQVQQAAAVAPPAAPPTVQPSGNVPGGVAQAATVPGAINLRQINLIGVYGRESDRRALVRLSNGRYVKVSVGDTLDGGRVAAIGDSALNYVKRGQTIRLDLPGA